MMTEEGFSLLMRLLDGCSLAGDTGCGCRCVGRGRGTVGVGRGNRRPVLRNIHQSNLDKWFEKFGFR